MASLVMTLPGATEVRSCTVQEFGAKFPSDEVTFPEKVVLEITNIERGIVGKCLELGKSSDKAKRLEAILTVFNAILKPYHATIVLRTEGGYDWNIDNTGTFSIMSVGAPFQLKISRAAVQEGKEQPKKA